MTSLWSLHPYSQSICFSEVKNGRVNRQAWPKQNNCGDLELRLVGCSSSQQGIHFGSLAKFTNGGICSHLFHCEVDGSDFSDNFLSGKNESI